jgi:L-lactate dehydrogenase complex protein LldF
MSSVSRKAFDQRVQHALGDTVLQTVVAEGQDYMQDLVRPARAEARWAVAVDEIARIRAHTLAHLDRYVDEFATNVEKRGGKVFFAADADEARRYVVGLARQQGTRLVVKSKSMVTEEIGLNPALEAIGAEVVETDLGEFILQLAHEKPFHIVAPAIHKSLEQIRDLFSVAAGRQLQADPQALTEYARSTLRERFFAADMGISGGNFGVAATGSVVLVTNEGNGRMTTTLPRTHVVVMGVERLVPTFGDLAPILEVLPRVGAGERITAYVTAITGPRRDDEADGSQELHVVIVDNGRSRILGGKYEEILKCIRCGACLDVCPVYRKIGGHAYDSVYPGPLGAVLSPLLDGLECHPELPFASSLCGACSEACSARIPLAQYIRELREDVAGSGSGSRVWPLGFEAFAAVAARPGLWGSAEAVALPLLRLMSAVGTMLNGWGPLASWTRGRDLPRVEGASFRALWRRRHQRQAS